MASPAAVGEIVPESVLEAGFVPQLLFDYLAREIFDRAPQSLRTLWLRTAQLPQFTASIAAELSGNPRAGRLLETLWRRRCFIDQSRGAEATYQYHALFRSLLCDRLRRGRSALAHRQQTLHAAEVLERHVDPQAALTLYREIEDWSAATRLITTQAKALFAVGRIQTLGSWIAALPAATTAALLLALACRAPQDAMAPACAERVLQLCRAEIGPAEKLSGAITLMQYLGEMKGVAQMAELIAEFDPPARSASCTAMQRVLWHWSSAKYCLLVADSAGAASIVREMLALCKESGLDHFQAQRWRRARGASRTCRDR